MLLFPMFKITVSLLVSISPKFPSNQPSQWMHHRESASNVYELVSRIQSTYLIHCDNWKQSQTWKISLTISNIHHYFYEFACSSCSSFSFAYTFMPAQISSALEDSIQTEMSMRRNFTRQAFLLCYVTFCSKTTYFINHSLPSNPLSFSLMSISSDSDFWLNQHINQT